VSEAERWVRQVIGRVAPGVPRPSPRVAILLDRLEPELWRRAAHEALDDAIAWTPRLGEPSLLIVEARNGEELRRLRVGGHGLVIARSLDEALGLGLRRRRESWREIYAPHAVLVGRGGRAALWFIRGLRPPGGEPSLLVLRPAAR
jgi:hypothetical protein